MTLSLAATVFSVLICIVILFQAALAAGMPWGEYAMGGKFSGRLPAPMRAACLVQIVILALLALIVLSKAEMLLPGWREFADVAVWFVVAFSVIASVLNLITKSVRERRIWAPVSILMLLSSLIVALG
ncbi:MULTISPECIES: hypothetical protein [Paenibacillus]|uniref:hypothetical protein n=1 Tax=Paenibacillus TaxID=44249 RepID=UPI00076CED47|nr:MULTISPECIES: hypothetical protein [Paenibacillus]KUP23369.1 hypothetical protein AWJ19_28740 [Paenibacillus sp. DMB5]MBY0010776.1 hypothetical protein [Paenibacillus typhae]